MLMICIGIALIFWLLVKLSKPFTAERVVPVEYNFPEGKTFVDAPPNEVEVTISGTGWDLISNYFSNDKAPIRFNFGNVNTLTINRDQIISNISQQMGSRSLEIQDVNHEYILINLENEVSKKVPVVFEKELSFAPQFNYRDSFRVVPDSVTVAGPESKIIAIQNWPTEKLIQENLKKTIRSNLKLQSSNDLQLRIAPSSVNVEIPVEQFTQKSLFLPIIIKNKPAVDSLNIFPSKIKLNCTVGLSQFEELSSADFTAEVDMKRVSLAQKNNSLSISLSKFPTFVKNINYTPKSVEFFIVKKKGS